jgi:hypothetical protein
VGILALIALQDPAPDTPTHWVSPSGAATSNCSKAAPCSITRAFALAGTAAMPAGSVVSWGAGIYTQPMISTTGGGTATAPIRFIGAGTDYGNGTRMTGTRTPLPADGWTLCPNAVWTYCMAFDEVTNYTVALVAQRPPVDTWVPIIVDDRQAYGGWQPSGRAYTLDEPVRYTRVYSTAATEAQHCTFYHDTTNNILKLHPCREVAPTDADNYYAGPDKWGTVTVTGNGDYLSVENVGWEHTTAHGLLILDSASGVNFSNIRMLASAMWAKGRGTTATDLRITTVGSQGAPSVECYSAQYGGAGLASRSCWQARAQGYNLLLGTENTGYYYNQVFDRVTLDRGWNAIEISGKNTVNHATFWGFANHGGQSSGSGVVVTNSVVMNSQDSWFSSDEDWGPHTFEHNLFYSSILFWCGRSGAANGAICPAEPPGWTVRLNIIGSMVTDWMDEPTLHRDCNVWMGRNFTADLLRISQATADVTRDYKTVEAIRAATTNDDNSKQLPSGRWYDRSIFAEFTSQEQWPVRLRVTPGATADLTLCGGVAGPDTLNELLSPSAPVVESVPVP